jgi:hypothetical protein
VRLKGTFANFIGEVRTLKRPVQIAAPLQVQGALTLPGQAPVSFDRTLGDGQPLSFQVEARGQGVPKVHLQARPAPVVRELRPPGASTWAAALSRSPQPVEQVVHRLMTTRLQIVRADQFQSFLADPDADGRARSVYEYETVAVKPHRVAPAPASQDDSGSDALLVALAVIGSVVVAGGGLVAWAHS